MIVKNLKNEEKYRIFGIFPNPVYVTQRELDLDLTEEKEIEDLVNETVNHEAIDYISNDMYIFNTKLKKLKEFIEDNIKIYVKKILNPVEELDFYITQSWLNIATSKQTNHRHSHQNSIISGVFYVSVEENDKIVFFDPNTILKGRIGFKPMEDNIWTSNEWSLNVRNNTLILFPSWLEHNAVIVGHRISIAFNVFARGLFGTKNETNELIL